MKRESAWRFNFILGAVLAAAVLISVWFIYCYGSANVDADNASELVLAKFLANEGTLLSKKWFYSTELRVLNTQLVFVPLFMVFDNYRIVRAVGSGVLLVLLLAGYLYMVAKAGLGKSAKLFSVVLAVPFCRCYQQFALFGLYYIPHMLISFVSVGLFFSAVCKWKEKKRTFAVEMGVLLLLALFAGMGGIRMLVVLYCPLFVAAVAYDLLQREKKHMVVSFAAMVAAGIGYIVNSTVLSDIYSFKNFNGTEFCDLNLLSRSDAILNGTLQFMGYRSGRRIFSAAALTNILAVGLLVLCVAAVVSLVRHLRELSQEKVFLVLFFAANSILNLIAFYFADMWEENGNYLIPFLIWLFPVLAIWLEERRNAAKVMSKGLLMVVLCAFLYNGAVHYTEWKNTNINSGKEAIVRYLVENGYERGYADFWDANVFTELSDGVLKMCNLRAMDASFAPLEWLMDKSFADWDEVSVQEDDSPVFVIADNAFAWENRDTLSYLNREYIIVQNSDYYVFGFENNEELSRIVNEGMKRE